MNKLKNFILWLLIAGYLFVVLGFVSNERMSVRCGQIEIHIQDSLQKRFVTEADVRRVISEENDSIEGSRTSRINLEQIEYRLEKLPAIRSAEAYQTVDGKFMVDVIQRTPIVRIIDRDNRHYYIGQQGYFFPALISYTEYVPVISGYIAPDLYQYGSIDSLQTEGDAALLRELFDMAQFIHNDEFWQAQIVQIFVGRDRGLELIPRLGAHIILLGSVDAYRDKLFKLETVYRNGLNKLGWNQYEIIDLRYNNQVICTKK